MSQNKYFATLQTPLQTWFVEASARRISHFTAQPPDNSWHKVVECPGSGAGVSVDYPAYSSPNTFVSGRRQNASPTRGDIPSLGVEADFEAMSETFIHLGERETWGAVSPFGILPEDQRQHLYVIGKTGSGKSTLLRNILIQYIASGYGVGLIDPHGDL